MFVFFLVFVLLLLLFFVLAVRAAMLVRLLQLGCAGLEREAFDALGLLELGSGTGKDVLELDIGDFVLGQGSLLEREVSVRPELDNVLEEEQVLLPGVGSLLSLDAFNGNRVDL